MPARRASPTRRGTGVRAGRCSFASLPISTESRQRGTPSWKRHRQLEVAVARQAILLLPALSVSVCIALAVPAALTAAQPAAKAAVVKRLAPRTAWGDPDLTGIWTGSTITPLERPDELAGKEFLTEQEAADLEKR